MFWRPKQKQTQTAALWLVRWAWRAWALQCTLALQQFNPTEEDDFQKTLLNWSAVGQISMPALGSRGT